jgi:signal recognition particle receptor subunit beta
MMPTVTNTPLVEFHRQRCRLISLSERLLVVLETLNMPLLYDKVRTQIGRLQTDTLKVLVVGEFNSGKSTVINALLGQKLLPVYPVPTTALLTEVKWGEQPRAVLHYRSSSDGFQQVPQEIACTQIETYLVITPEGENLYERVELFWPLALCREGVELLDSPGLDDDEVYLEATLQRVSDVDAVLFVLACDALPSREELLLIDRIRCAGHNVIFFLCNRFDLVEPSCQEMVKQRRITQLSPMTACGDQHIFFTNAKGALTRRIDGSSGQFEQARIQDVEEVLYAFLQERERDRLLDSS